MGEEMNLQSQEFQEIPKEIKPKKTTPKYMLVNLLKTKYKAIREKDTLLQAMMKISANFSSE